MLTFFPWPARSAAFLVICSLLGLVVGLGLIRSVSFDYVLIMFCAVRVVSCDK